MANDVSLTAAYARWRASRLGRITDAIEQRELLRRCAPIAGRKILDVGCGDGLFSIALAKAGAVVTGVDIEEHMLEAATANASREGACVAFRKADARSLPFAEASFDVVLAVSSLCLIKDRDKALAEMARVLKPGSRLVIGELGAWSLWNTIRRLRGLMGARPWRDAHFFTPADLRRMLQRADFQDVAIAGAIYYPPIGLLAALMAHLDSYFTKLGCFGAAFLLATANRPDAKPASN